MMSTPLPPPSKAGLLGTIIRVIEVDPPGPSPHVDGAADDTE